MNQIFKLKLVALMATLSGTLGSCHAMQVDGSSTDAFGGGIVRTAEPAFDGAFGSHNSAKPLADYGSDGELPPIVSPGYASEFQANPQQSFVLPPIVTPGSANDSATLPEIVQAPATLPEIVQAPEKQATPNMFSPLAPLQVPTGFGAYATTPEYGTEAQDSESQLAAVPIVQGSDYSMPAPIIQASEASTDNSDSSVQQAQWGSGVSSSGVRLYPSATSAGYSRSPELPPIVRGQVVAPSVNVPSIVTGSSIPLPPVISTSSQIVTPMNSMAPAQFPMNSVPMESYPMESYQTDGNPMESVQMNSVPMDMGQTYFSSPPVEAPVISSGCSSCNGGGCSSCGASTQGADVAGCNSCGPGGCFNDDMVSDRFGCCGSVYSARRYLIAEALYFNRDDGLIANSNFGALNSFDGNLGWRFTIGNRSDATSGRELSYFGTSEMEQSVTRNSAAERINARFNGFDGFSSTDTSAFKEAFRQEESKSTEIHSLEYNKVRWGWDVVKSFVGLRYINVQDEYRMLSSSATFPGTATRRVHDGLFEMNTQNNLIGPHVGGELFYDVGYRLSWSLASKAGAYANFNKVDTRYRNDGTQFLDVEDNNGTLSTSLELNLIGHYQLSQQARFRFGYNALWLGDVASVSDNLSTVLSPTTGTNTSDSDAMFFHGVSLGFEIYR